MPATFDWESYHGTATGSPALGTTLATGLTDQNFKNIDDATTVYNTVPISAGNNSFSKYVFGKFSGTFTTIQTGLWAHTAGTMGTGITLKGIVSSTYAAPDVVTNAALTVDMTTAISISSGQTVLFTPTSPATASPTSSCSSNPCYTQFLISQMQTSGSAVAGDSTTATYSIQYLEN